MSYQYVSRLGLPCALITTNRYKYMNHTILQYYYDQIKKTDSIENDVDNFWLNLLPDYFQQKLEFGIELEPRPLPEVTKKRVDWTIRCIKNLATQKLVALMEDKRKGKETQPAEWRDAVAQLTRYLRLVRTEPRQDATHTLYGAVNIGSYTRFYQLDPDQQECIDYPGTNGKPYELAKDEAGIHAILLELVQKTAH